MTKPKTGKIITDGDILKEVADAEWHDTVGAVKIAIRLARQQGIAQGKCNGCICKSMAERAVADNDIYHQGLVKGRAEQDKRRDIPNKNRQSMAIYRAEKQAYAKGRDENKDKYFNAGIQKGQSDIKARLMKLIKTNCKGCSGYYDIEQALAEATKEGEGE